MDATEPDVQEGDNVDGRTLTDVPPAPEPIEEIAPPQAYSFLTVWVSLGEICPLNGCYLPKVLL
ncbi:hypothetical protein Bca101_086323 [Brassica carinata]